MYGICPTRLSKFRGPINKNAKVHADEWVQIRRHAPKAAATPAATSPSSSPLPTAAFAPVSGADVGEVVLVDFEVGVED